MKIMTQNKFDALIVGAGLNGLLTGCILSDKGLSIAIIDRGNFLNYNTFLEDFRTTAVAAGSKNLLRKFGIWKYVNLHACPIKKIKVLDRKYVNKIDFLNPNLNTPLGYIIKNNILKSKFLDILLTKKNVLPGNLLMYSVCQLS